MQDLAKDHLRIDHDMSDAWHVRNRLYREVVWPAHVELRAEQDLLLTQELQPRRAR